MDGTSLGRFVFVLIVLAALAAPGIAAAQPTERVSVDSAEVEGNDASDTTSMSATGRFVAFISEADNLVDGDDNEAGRHLRARPSDGRRPRRSASAAARLGRQRLQRRSPHQPGRALRRVLVVLRQPRGRRHERRGRHLHARSPGGDHAAREPDRCRRPVRERGQLPAGRQLRRTLRRVPVRSPTISWRVTRRAISTSSCAIASPARRCARAWGPEAPRPTTTAGTPRSARQRERGGLHVARHATSLVRRTRTSPADVFVRDIAAQTTTRVSVDCRRRAGQRLQPRARAHRRTGSYVVFQSYADNLVVGDTNEPDRHLPAQPAVGQHGAREPDRRRRARGRQLHPPRHQRGRALRLLRDAGDGPGRGRHEQHRRRHGARPDGGHDDAGERQHHGRGGQRRVLRAADQRQRARRRLLVVRDEPRRRPTPTTCPMCS